MNDEVVNSVFDPKDPNFLKNAIIYRLKGLCDKLEGADKCTICETIHFLESSNEEKKDGSLWLVLLFLIFFGFSNNFPSFDFETFSKILKDSANKAKEEEDSK